MASFLPLLLIGRRDVPDDLRPDAYSLSITDVLAVADELLLQHRAALPVRAVTRQRARPETDAFARWLRATSGAIEGLLPLDAAGRLVRRRVAGNAYAT